MREIEIHKVEGDLAKQVGVVALDEPGEGGANHKYSIYLPNLEEVVLKFQEGPIKIAGVNGVTHEALLAVVIDRLRGFQDGPFKCEENETALQYVSLALIELQKRTQKRIGLGIEGTNQMEKDVEGNVDSTPANEPTTEGTGTEKVEGYDEAGGQSSWAGVDANTLQNGGRLEGFNMITDTEVGDQAGWSDVVDAQLENPSGEIGTIIGNIQFATPETQGE